jgi:hypothetical protein
VRDNVRADSGAATMGEQIAMAIIYGFVVVAAALVVVDLYRKLD